MSGLRVPRRADGLVESADRRCLWTPHTAVVVPPPAQGLCRGPCQKRGLPQPSADPLRQLDDDPLRAADVAEPIPVPVALHLANELRPAGSQAGDDGVDVCY